MDETKPLSDETPVTFPYEADADAKIAALRALAGDFTLPEPRSLTSSERRLVSATSLAFVEKAANFGRAMPAVGGATNSNVEVMRDGEAYATAYERFVGEIDSLRQLVRKSIVLRRLKNVRHARSIYRAAKNYLLLEGGDDVKSHVDEMKKALNRRRRRTAPSAPQPEPTPAPTPTTV